MGSIGHTKKIRILIRIFSLADLGEHALALALQNSSQGAKAKKKKKKKKKKRDKKKKEKKQSLYILKMVTK